MKTINWIIAAAALSFVHPAQAAVGDPEVIIYRASGVADNGNMATSFQCTNFSGVNETIRVVVRASTSAILANVAVPVPHLNTAILSTTEVTIFNDTGLMTGSVNGGTVAIAATSINITCTAMILQVATTVPVGVQLHMTRFNPIPGTQE